MHWKTTAHTATPACQKGDFEVHSSPAHYTVLSSMCATVSSKARPRSLPVASFLVTEQGDTAVVHLPPE